MSETINTGDTYLGDGLYASYDEVHIMLKTERVESIMDGPVIHYIGLEPYVFEALLQFALKIGWLEKGQVI